MSKSEFYNSLCLKKAGSIGSNKSEQKSKISKYKIITRGLWVTSLN